LILGEEQARAFHHSVAQLILISPKTRKDIQSTVAFLRTTVTSPDEDECQKLKILLKHLQGMIYMPLIPKAD
jgi:hypothetical protein